MRYRSRRVGDTGVRLRIRALAHRRRRFVYRRLHVLLRREGWRMNHKRFRRLYREEKCKFGSVAPANALWAYVRRWHCHTVPTSAGHSISCQTASTMAGAFAS